MRLKNIVILFTLISQVLFAKSSINGNPIFPNEKLWKKHWTEDIQPYWHMTNPKDTAGLGYTSGNFPTFRDRSGKPTDKSERYVRMLARQVYTYMIGYSLTGDEELLQLALKGKKWIDTHAIDEGKGFFTILNQDGSVANDSKTAQDIAYITNCYAMDYYITRSVESRVMVNKTLDLLFDSPFYDSSRGLIFDAFNNELTVKQEFKMADVDLVSILDQVNAYMLLMTNQTATGSKERREYLQTLCRLGDLLILYFWEDGVFWNTVSNRVHFDVDHMDVGHTLKSYWMLHRINEYWQSEYHYPIYTKELSYIDKMVREAGSESTGFWKKGITPEFSFKMENPDWWIQIEANQLCADLSLKNKDYLSILNKKGKCWLTSNFVDSGFGITSGLLSNGEPYPGQNASWDNKANHWKNGYHESEHAYILNIVSQVHESNDKSVVLFFALPKLKNRDIIYKTLKPYFFLGEVDTVEFIGKKPVGTTNRFTAKVRFKNVH